MTYGDFTLRTDVQDADKLGGHRGTTKVGAEEPESVWTWATIKAAIASLFAPLVSPALTGTPTAPTAAPGTTSTQLSTTAFVATAIAANGNGVTVVAFPANSAASGAVGQIACNADVLGVYVGQGGSGGVNWVFMHIHQRA